MIKDVKLLKTKRLNDLWVFLQRGSTTWQVYTKVKGYEVFLEWFKELVSFLPA